MLWGVRETNQHTFSVLNATDDPSLLMGQVNMLDDNLCLLVDAIEAKGMWDNTLMVLTSDNGGCILLSESGASNWPLRGGK